MYCTTETIRVCKISECSILGSVHRLTVPYCSVPFQEVVRRAGSVHKGTEKNQANRSTTGPKIRRYRKVKQKLKRYISYRSVPCEQKWYDIVPFRSKVNKETGPLS